MQTNYGPIQVEVDHAAKRATLTIRRRLEPLSDSTIERLKQWAIDVTEASYPGYRILDMSCNTKEINHE